MYTLSQRIRSRPIDNESYDRSLKSNSRTIVLETFENLEDASVALAKKQGSRKNMEEFFIEFRLDVKKPKISAAHAFPGKTHLKPQAEALHHLYEETRFQRNSFTKKVMASSKMLHCYRSHSFSRRK